MKRGTPYATWSLGHRPALDGLRGVAIVLVVMCHAHVPGMTGGGAVGVAMFFTLSGFLITGLLLEEHDRGRISLRRFYVRRVRRLFPALFVSTAVIVAVSLFLGPWFLLAEDVAPVLLHYGNWIEADPFDQLGALGGTWSLAIEEQFYLLWPLVLCAVAPVSRRAVVAVAVLGATASLAARVVELAGPGVYDRIYYGSDMVAFALLAGAALVAWQGSRAPHMSRPLVAVSALSAIAGLTTMKALTAALIALPLTGAATVVLLWAVTGRDGWTPLEVPVLRWLGSRSYSLYLWHGPILWVLREKVGVPWSGLVVAGLVSLLVAEASYRWVETPFRRRSLKRPEQSEEVLRRKLAVPDRDVRDVR